MGLSGIFSSSPQSPQKSQATDLNLEKEEVFRKLTEELIQVKEKNAKLESSQRIAVAERKEAVYRMKDLEDSLRMKEGILDNLERRIEHLENENNRLLSVETELSLLREDQQLHPLSSSDASFRFTQLSSIFTQLRDTLSCAVCYEPYIKDQAVSLMCGHSFCRDCFTKWELRHVEAWKMNPNQQGVYPGADCPECRSREVRRGKVRIWALEETVRLVDRAVREIEKNQFTPEKRKDEVTSAVEVDDLISMEEETGAEEARGGIGGGGEEVREDTSTLDAFHQSGTDNASTEPLLSTSTSFQDQVPDHPTASSAETPSFDPSQLSPTLSTPVDSSLPSASLSASLTTPSASVNQPLTSSHRSSPLSETLENPRSDHPEDHHPPPPPSAPSSITQDTEMHDRVLPVAVAVEEDPEELEEARNLLRPRTPNPYIAVFRR